MKRGRFLHYGLVAGLLSLLVQAFPVHAEEVMKDRLVALNVSGQGLVAVRAKTLEVRELVVVTVSDIGKRSAWQRDFYLGSVPLFPETVDELTDDDIASAVSEFSEFLASHPQAANILGKEREKWTELQSLKLEAKAEQEAQLRAELQEKIQEFMTRKYDPKQKYSSEELIDLATEARSLMDQLPEEAEKIGEFMKPWLEHAKHVEEGKIYYQEEWLTPEEVKQKRQEVLQKAMDKFMEEGADLKMEGVVVPQMSILLASGVILVTLILILYLFLWLASSRGGTLTFGGALLLLLGLAVLGAYTYFGFKIFSGASTIDAYLAQPSGDSDVDVSSVQRTLFLASKPKAFSLTKEDREVVLQDQQINKLLGDHLEFELAEESELFDMERVGFACLFLGDKVVLLDEVVVFGKSFLYRYELSHNITETLIQFTDFNAYLGGATLPGQVANHMWMKVRRHLREFLNRTGLPDVYQISDVKDGTITVRMSKVPEKLKASKTEMNSSEKSEPSTGPDVPNEPGS
ncbi:MAG: hypothetical protein AAF558_09505 [Verrucomicrobiota bacterium]